MNRFYFQDIEKRKALMLASVEMDPNSGCWLWVHFVNREGYGVCNRWLKEKKRAYLAHRESYSAFVGKIPDGKLVLHKCDTPSCVNPDHLFIGTHQDNVDDKMKKGRHGHKRVDRTRRMGEQELKIAVDPTIPIRAAARITGYATSTIRDRRVKALAT